MKYKVLGWTDYDSFDFEDGDNTDAAVAAIIEDIKAYGYCFSGYAHQEYSGGVPVLNDGLARRFSQRGWGSVMAQAHGFFGPVDYSNFAYHFPADEEIMPDHKRWVTPDDIEKLTALDEEFLVNLSSGELAKAIKHSVVEINDLPNFKLLELNDTVVLADGKRVVKYTVSDYERGWLIRDKGAPRPIYRDELFELMYSSSERIKKYANAAYEAGTKIIKIYLESKK